MLNAVESEWPALLYEQDLMNKVRIADTESDDDDESRDSEKKRNVNEGGGTMLRAAPESRRTDSKHNGQEKEAEQSNLGGRPNKR
jgi:hypothetical protein